MGGEDSDSVSLPLSESVRDEARNHRENSTALGEMLRRQINSSVRCQRLVTWSVTS